MGFKKAEKKKSKLRLALIGVSGSGKTYSALEIATGIASQTNENIAFIDTEKGSSHLYADLFDFDVIELKEPYKVDDYIKAIKEAEKSEYKILIIDSLTHAWQYTLDYVDSLAKTKKYANNSFRAWSEGTPLYNKLINAILNFDGHIIVTTRAKTEHAVKSVDGKNKVEKVGVGAENRKGIEYEFTIVAEGGIDHNFEFTKDRTGLFQDQVINKPSRKVGEKMIEFLNTGIEVDTTEEKKLEMLAAIDTCYQKYEEVKALVEEYKETIDKTNVTDLNYDEVKMLYELVKAKAIELGNNKKKGDGAA